ncbi:Hypothetical protein HEAR2191 [Herminiimonas arsenicoxydans]|uniref:Uncharacterized protein n=1 Tax=Herminiimonas arsenicoxydans TaxID=204773 RepID=A4G740_HERAR|nr:Hypothetical protein HEAR2191 [Herminiimonas arsenicoxydans]
MDAHLRTTCSGGPSKKSSNLQQRLYCMAEQNFNVTVLHSGGWSGAELIVTKAPEQNLLAQTRTLMS